jgi:hypothetical protein
MGRQTVNILVRQQLTHVHGRAMVVITVRITPVVRRLVRTITVQKKKTLVMHAHQIQQRRRIIHQVAKTAYVIRLNTGTAAVVRIQMRDITVELAIVKWYARLGLTALAGPAVVHLWRRGTGTMVAV